VRALLWVIVSFLETFVEGGSIFCMART
jgi:hypothetical protein